MRWPIVTLVSCGGGSRSSGGSACTGVRPRRGDVVTAIAISGHRNLVGPVKPRALAAGPVVPPAPSPDLLPGQPRVLLAQPADHSPPQVVAEIRMPSGSSATWRVRNDQPPQRRGERPVHRRHL